MTGQHISFKSRRKSSPAGLVAGPQAPADRAAGVVAAAPADAFRAANRQAVQMAAFATAMSARTDGLTQNQVDATRTLAEQMLDHGDPLRLAVLHFATMFEEYRYDPAALRLFGEELDRAVNADLNPGRPALRERRDIEG